MVRISQSMTIFVIAVISVFLASCQNGTGGGTSALDKNLLKGSWQLTASKSPNEAQETVADVNGYINDDRFFVTFDDTIITRTNIHKDRLDYSKTATYPYRIEGNKIVVMDNMNSNSLVRSLNSNTLEIVIEKNGTYLKMSRVSPNVVQAAQVEIQEGLNRWQPSFSISGGSAKSVCTLIETPAHTIDRCGATRKHGGEVHNEKIEFRGSSYDLWGAPQTFEKLFAYECNNSCGEKQIFLAEVMWDCVSTTEIAAEGIASSWSGDSRSQKSACSEINQNYHSDLTKHFSIFIRKKFNSLPPADMPAAGAGIRYWDESKK